MDINYKDIITLEDGNEYVVVSKINYDGKDYIYLVDIKNTSNIKFAEIEIEGEKTYISVIDNNEKELLDKIIKLFFEDTKEIYDDSNE